MSKSSDRYSYCVKISFKEKNRNANIGDRMVKYKNSGLYEDKITFSDEGIHIELSRSKKFPDGSILSNANNTINTQIIKALLCYYAISVNFPQIKDILILRREHKKVDYEYEECKFLIQPIISRGFNSRQLTFTSSIIDPLLEESQKGQSFRIAMSYWLKGYASTDEYFKFDHYWRAFNRLYMYQGESIKEFDCLINMRNFIIQNESIFCKSISITNMYSQAELHNFRWNKMILNDYDTRTKTQALKDFILRYNDHRIMNLLNEKIVCRKQYLSEMGLDTIVNNHIHNHSSTVQDGELVTLIAIKYAYFIRNRLFHGEVPDGTFKIKKDNIDKEICRINKLLEVLIWELIENHNLFR